MIIVDDLKALDKTQRAAFVASLLGWTLDAFDFFILVFIVKSIADDFKVQVSAVSLGIALTLMMRPVGAFVFGWLADRFGRRPILMLDVMLFAGLEFASAFSPNLPTLLVLRLLFGFAMGGEWGIGASLALESIPAKSRGVVSGLLQEGYALGYLLAALVNIFADRLGWRGMLMVGVAPALLVLYIREHVPESPAFEAVREKARARRAARPPRPTLPPVRRPALLAMHALLLCGGLAIWPFAQAVMQGAALRAEVVGLIGAALCLAGLSLAYALRGAAEEAVRAHAAFVLFTFWLAVTGAVLAGLILFSIDKPLHALGVARGIGAGVAAALLSAWFLARGAFALGLVRAGEGMRAADPESLSGAMTARWPLLIYVVILMTAFNFFSHGTQDLYPTFLKVQHKFSPALVSTLTIVGNLGAIVGGLSFGALSERIGRKRAIALAALLALPIIPLWAFSATPLLLGAGAFLIQIAVQGAWGIVPVHLNELSPDAARGTFPGFAYQLGNLIASGNAVIQAGIAESRGDNYGFALALVAGIVALTLAALAFFGPEAKGVRFGAS